MAEPVKLNVRVDVDALVAKLGEKAGPALISAMQQALIEEAATEGVLTATEVYAERGLAARTGTLRQEIQSFDAGQSDDDLELKIGVPDASPASRYAYLLEEGERTIRPLKGEYLTIPIGANLSDAGVPKYISPRQVQSDGAKFLRIGAKLYFGIDDGKKFSPLFALVRQSKVKGRNVLGPALERARPTMTEMVQRRVDALMAEA